MRTSALGSILRSFTATLSMSLIIAVDAHADEPEIYYVPNVVDQFNKLALRPEALGFALFNSPNPSLCRHYQGMARSHGTGTPYIFLTRSGNDPGFTTPCPPSDVDGPGNLLVVRMDSRDTSGERLRSNRLARDSDISRNDPVFGDLFATPPDYRDTVKTWFDFGGQNGWPDYQHPGGIQLVGNVLAVPLDKPSQSGAPEKIVQFLDVTNPEAPVPTSFFEPEEVPDSTVIGITPVIGPNGVGLRYLLLVTGGRNTTIGMYRSNPTPDDDPNTNDAPVTTDLKSRHLTWEHLRNWSESQIEACLGADWPTGLQDPHQMLNFVRQDSLTGTLFLIGANNTLILDEDRLHLYKVNVDAYGNPEQCLLNRLASKHVTSSPIMSGGDSANFAASSGVYVSPSGELIVYGAEYENDGPLFIDADGNYGVRRTVRFAEWRHEEMVRRNSPTLQPSIDVGELFEVDEGGTLPLSASARGPITKAWIQFFEDKGLGQDDFGGFFDSDKWLVVDYDDWNKDNFDNFAKLHFDDEADSMRWFAPVGCSMRINQHAFDDPSYYGQYSKVLDGAATPQGEPKIEWDLDSVTSDSSDQSRTIGDTISSMEFFEDCSTYYNTPVDVAWDLDFDSTFETLGDNADYSAAGLDGPGVRIILVRAKHATDPTFLGQSAPKPIRIEIRNVPPVIESLALEDSFGSLATFVLVNVDYVAKATFSDAGEPDRQTASLDWGDGTVVASANFDQFSDAFGGALGSIGHRYRYPVSGNYTLRVSVLDDDGGEAQAETSVDVLTPIEALELMLEQLRLLADSTTQAQVLAALDRARSDLEGNNNGNAVNGAIDKLADENPVAALTRLAAFVTEIMKAEAAGAGDLSGLKYMVTTIAESVAQSEYLRVLAAVPTPNSGQQQQILTIGAAIAQGHSLLSMGDYLGAIDGYRVAAVRASGM